MPHFVRASRLAAVLVSLLLVSGCGIDLGVDRDLDLVTTTAADGRGAIRPAPVPTGCTHTVTDTDVMARVMDAAGPGERICLLGDLHAKRLVLNRSGTPDQPIELVGDGHTILRGITVHASNIKISWVNVVRPRGPGIYLNGNNNTLLHNTVLSPRGEDGDGLRFFGANVTIAHNTIRDTRHLGGAHADCMQTYATDEKHVASQNVRITDNRCEMISNICLIAEGPNSEAGDGSGIGVSSNFVFRNNYCDNHASQATMLDDIRHMTITGNELHGEKAKAFAFQNNSTHAVVANNVLGPKIDYAVGMDESSKPGYRGPDVGGRP